MSIPQELLVFLTQECPLPIPGGPHICYWLPPSIRTTNSPIPPSHLFFGGKKKFKNFKNNFIKLNNYNENKLRESLLELYEPYNGIDKGSENRSNNLEFPLVDVSYKGVFQLLGVDVVLQLWICLLSDQRVSLHSSIPSRSLSLSLSLSL